MSQYGSQTMRNLHFRVICSVSTACLFMLLMLKPGSAADIQLEHSVEREGASWGTDDAFRNELNLRASAVPALYRMPLVRPRPRYVDVRSISVSKGRFVENRAALYRSLGICMDSTLPAVDSALGNAVDVFLQEIAGQRAAASPLQIFFRQVDMRSVPFAECDAILVRGRWDEFPYRYLPDQRGGGAYWEGRVYGVFYRHDLNSIPVITVHPDIQITFNPTGRRYVGERFGRLEVDGRVLLLHEIGHLLGFAHIELQPLDDTMLHPIGSVMGQSNDQRVRELLKVRFFNSVDLWRIWDPWQVSVYRYFLTRKFSSDAGPANPVW